MSNWRRKGDRFNNQEIGRTNSSYYRNSPHGGSSNWQPAIPSWEKRFCTSLGSYSWKKFLEAKEFTYLYDNILNWDDSAGKEAFENAKNRFYAKIHDIPCNIKQPDPFLYTDEIDWSSKVDENLILDLESDYVDDNHEQVVIFGDAIPDPYKDYSSYGWGESENVKKVVENGIDWDQRFHNEEREVCYENAWWVSNGNDVKERVKGDQGWNVYENGNKWRSNGNVNQRSRQWRNNNSYRNNNSNNNGNWRSSTGQGRGNRRESVF